jgi:hypothetical protein
MSAPPPKRARTHTTEDPLASELLEKLPSLPKILQPIDSVSSAMQSSSVQSVVPPRGFAFRTGAQSPRASLPTRNVCSLEYSQLHSAFMCARCVQFPTHSSDVPQMLASETLELEHAALGVPAPDESLPARALAVWVHVAQDHDAKMPLGAKMLDAIAHWASRIQPLVRCTVVSGGDSDAMLERTSAETTTMLVGDRILAPEAVNDCIRVSLRWGERVGDKEAQIRTETAFRSDRPQTATAALALVQKLTVGLARAHGVRLPSVVYETTGRTVPQDAFVRAFQKAAEEFEAMKHGKDCIQLSSLAQQCSHQFVLQDTGVHIRVCARRTEHNRSGSGGAEEQNWLLESENFHGVLLAFDHSTVAVREFALRSATLSMPIGAIEESWGLHLCALQPRRTRLGELVSLYNPVGRAGVEIAPLWVHAPAVRPLDCALFDNFELVPCSYESTLPELPCLQPSRRQLHRRCHQLCQSLLGDRPCTASPSTVSDDGTVDPALEMEEDALNAEDVFYLSALRMRVGHVRTSVGDAIAAMQEAGAPPLAIGVLADAASITGLEASLRSVLEVVQERLRASMCGEAESARAVARDREEMVSAALFEDRLTSVARRERGATRVDCGKYVERLARALSLAPRGRVTICAGGAPCASEAFQLMWQSVHDRASAASRAVEPAFEHVAELVDALDSESEAEWQERAEHTLLSALASVAAEADQRGGEVFVVCTNTRDRVRYRVERVGVPVARPSSLDEMCRHANPRLLVLERDEGFKVHLHGSTKTD